MTNYSNIKNEIERDIKSAVYPEQIAHLEEKIDTLIRELAEVRPRVAERREHIKKNIRRIYSVSLWKNKGVYRDTNLVNGEFVSNNITQEQSGVHYSVDVHVYFYDLSLIGTQQKQYGEMKMITVPILQIPNWGGYSYTLSKGFSWKKKDLALQYAEKIAKEGNAVLRPASDFGEIVNDTCLYSTGAHNSPFEAWELRVNKE